MAETIGTLADKLSILELKIYHMGEQWRRPDAGASHRRLCRARLSILFRQRRDLQQELTGLFERYRQGLWEPRVYRQFKMYNDPRFRLPERVSKQRAGE